MFWTNGIFKQNPRLFKLLILHSADSFAAMADQQAAVNASSDGRWTDGKKLADRVEDNWFANKQTDADEQVDKEQMEEAGR